MDFWVSANNLRHRKSMTQYFVTVTNLSKTNSFCNFYLIFFNTISYQGPYSFLILRRRPNIKTLIFFAVSLSKRNNALCSGEKTLWICNIDYSYISWYLESVQLPIKNYYTICTFFWDSNLSTLIIFFSKARIKKWNNKILFYPRL